MIVTDGVHLTSTDLDELHTFAVSIGMKREWFQDNRIPHYDTWGIMSKRAIDAGAVKVTSVDIVKMWEKTMKAITVQQPWASAIMAGIKPVENRKWRTNYTGPLVIHAGLQPWPNKITTEHYKLLLPICPLSTLPYGAILGVVDMKGCEHYRYELATAFATGPYCWILENPRKLKRPIPYRGKQGIWHVPDEIMREVS